MPEVRKIKIVRLFDDAIIPSYGSDAAAGADLFAHLDTEWVSIAPHATAMVGTGVAVAVPDGFFGGVYARSGLSAKEGLRPANCVGVVDSDYTGEVIVALHNDSNVWRKIENGQRIAQLVVQPYVRAEWDEVASLDATGRGAGGFGSTGKD